MTGTLTTDLVASGTTFARLRAEWAALHEQSSAGPFLSWEWLYTSWRRVTPGRQLRLIIARDAAGALVGVLPLSEERHSSGARVWRFLGDRTIGSDYLDCLAPRGMEAEVGQAMWRAALSNPACDVLEVLDLPESSPSRETLRLLATSQRLFHDEESRYQCPVLALGGPKELRHLPRQENVRRHRRKLESQPGFSITTSESPADLPRPLAEFMHLHRRRWDPHGGSEAITGAHIEGFHRDVTHLLGERAMVRLYSLRLDERPVASLYLLRRGTYRAMYQCAYDPAFGRLSPGLVLLAQSVEDSLVEGATEYDFLRGTEPYKLEWANAVRRTVGIRIARPSLAGLMYLALDRALTGARRAAKRALPSGCVRAVRGILRTIARA